jgi:peptidoglycan/xylan/chitin deacetylase (PgdA/CDA1 family)
MSVSTKTIFALALAAALLAVAPLCSGCRQQTQAADMPARVELPDVARALEEGMAAHSPWRAVDRTALATSLGWGQVSSGNKGARRIALTFDAGADAGATAQVLDELEAAGLECTFFVTGQFALSNPGLLARMYADGHELGNHSWSHPKFTGVSAPEVASQIERTEQIVHELTGMTTKPYFRFPYGAGSSSLVKQINGLGYMGVLWTFDTLDSLGANAAAIRGRVSAHAAPGAIVLMHCSSAEEAKALPLVIDDLRAAGYDLVTLTQVLQPPAAPGSS